MLAYHDREWGVPIHDDRLLFEFLILEGAQAGLSWMTILRKRDAYRKAFKDFDPAVVARFRQTTVDRLLTVTAIVRNRLKIESAVSTAGTEPEPNQSTKIGTTATLGIDENPISSG